MTNDVKDSIWLVDDADIIHRAIRLMLPGYNIRSFYSGEEFLEFVGTREYDLPDLILLDILMGKISGFEVLVKLMQIIEFRDIPVLILSTKESIDDKVRGLELGASDYVVKPFYDKELSARIKVHIRIKKNQDELRKKVILDFLTDTFNRRHLFDRLKTHFNVHQRYRMPLSLIFFDIDYFKQINDTHGHLTGDFILKELCREIKSVIRSEDELFRYGGEEFVLIVPFTSKANTEMFAEKIRRKIEAKRFMYQDEVIKVTLSLGAASLPDDHVEDIESLLDIADKRMIAAKNSGRNRVISNG